MNGNLQTNTCDTDRLESYLNGELSEVQELEFTAHLDQCEPCRRSLELRAADPEAWSEAEQFLQPFTFDAEQISPPRSRGPQIQQVLDALAPTDDPAMLGRLGGYEVSGVVGSGGMGVVLKAVDKSLDRTVAIKVLAPHLATSGAARKRFAREAKAAAAVLHPNVIAIHSVSNDETLPYLVMPYVRGASLQKRLDAEGPLALTEILRIGSQIAAGLSAAHAQGLVHRDIKPANILLEDGIERVAITDFGLARAVDDATITRSGVIAGTPQYMSPEQARGEPIDQRSDLFSLGSVLYAICTGRPPFRAETTFGVMRRITDDEPTSIRKINSDIPEWLCVIVARLMSKRAADRFDSAEEVQELLEQCLAHVQQPDSVPLPESLVPQPSGVGSFFRSHRTGVIAMLGVFGFCLLGMLFWQGTEPPDIAGIWTGDEWGTVVLEAKRPGHYEGTYTETIKDNPGTIRVQWSRIERRFNGTWREGEDRFGKISVRLVDDEIRGGWTTNRKSEINPGTPELADLSWKKTNALATSIAGILTYRGQPVAGATVHVGLNRRPGVNDAVTDDAGRFEISLVRESKVVERGTPTVLVARHPQFKNAQVTLTEIPATVEIAFETKRALWETDEKGAPVAQFSPGGAVAYDRSSFSYGFDCTLSQPRHVVLGVVQYIDEQNSVSHEISQLGFYFASPQDVLNARAQVTWSMEKVQLLQIRGPLRFGVRDIREVKQGQGDWIVRIKGTSESGDEFDRSVRLAGKQPFVRSKALPDDPEHGPLLGLDPATTTWDVASPERPFRFEAGKWSWVEAGQWSPKKVGWHTENLFEASDEKGRVVGRIQVKLLVCPMLPGAKVNWTKPILQNGDWKEDEEVKQAIGDTLLLNEGGDAAISHRVPFEVGATYLRGGDRITIDEVRGTADTMHEGNMYEIKGTYRLASQDKATLAAYITDDGTVEKRSQQPGAVPTQKTQSMTVERGEGRFALILYMWHDGKPHVSFYPESGENGFGHVYFGTGESVLKKGWWEAPHTDADREKYATLFDEFNVLMNQGQYAEAYDIAQKAKQLAPDVTAIHHWDFKSRFAQHNQARKRGADEWELKELSKLPIHRVDDPQVPHVVSPPTPIEVIRELERSQGLDKNSLTDSYERNAENFRIIVEPVYDKVDPPRFLPLVGRASLHRVRFKCTVYYTEANEEISKVFNIDADHLHVMESETKATTSGRNVEQPPIEFPSTQLKRLRHITTNSFINIIDISPDGTLVAVNNGYPTERLSDKPTLEDENWKPFVSIFSTASGKLMNTLQVLTDEEDALLDNTETLSYAAVTDIAFHPDGNLLAVGTSIGQVKMFDASSGKLIKVYDDEQNRLLENATPENWKSIKRALRKVASLAISPDGGMLAVIGWSFADDQWRLKIWDVKTGELKHILVGHEWAWALNFSPDGKMLATAGSWREQDARKTGGILWDTRTGKEIRKIAASESEHNNSVAFSPDSKLVAFGTSTLFQGEKQYEPTSDLAIVHTETGKLKWRRKFTGWVKPIAFTPEGDAIAVLRSGIMIQFLDADSGNHMYEILANNSSQSGKWYDFAISSRSNLMAVGGASESRNRGVLEVWSITGDSESKATTSGRNGEQPLIDFPTPPIYGGRNPKTGDVELNPAWANPVRQMLVKANAIELISGEQRLHYDIPDNVRGDEARKLIGVLAVLMPGGRVSWKPDTAEIRLIEVDPASWKVAESLLPAAFEAIVDPSVLEKPKGDTAGAFDSHDPAELIAQVKHLRRVSVENLLSDVPALYDTARWFWELSLSLEQEAELRTQARESANRAARLREDGNEEEAKANEARSEVLTTQADDLAAEREVALRRRDAAEAARDEAKLLAARISVFKEEGKTHEAEQLQQQLNQLLWRLDPDSFRVRDLQNRIIDARTRGNHEIAYQLEAERRTLLNALDERYMGGDISAGERDPTQAP